MTNTPQAMTVIPVSLYPTWWGGATTVEVQTVTNGNVIAAPADVELFPHGVSVPDEPANPSGAWDAAVLPWSQIINIHKAS